MPRSSHVQLAEYLAELVGFVDLSSSSSVGVPKLALTLADDIAVGFPAVLDSMYTGQVPLRIQNAMQELHTSNNAKDAWASGSLSDQVAQALYGLVAGDGSTDQAAAPTAAAPSGAVKLVRGYAKALHHLGVTVGTPSSALREALAREEIQCLQAAQRARSADPTADTAWAWGTHTALQRARAMQRLVSAPQVNPADTAAVKAAYEGEGGSIFCPGEGALPWAPWGRFCAAPEDTAAQADGKQADTEGKEGGAGGAAAGEGKEGDSADAAHTHPPLEPLHVYGDLLRGAPPLHWEIGYHYWPAGSCMEQLRGGSGAGQKMQEGIEVATWKRPGEPAPVRRPQPIGLDIDDRQPDQFPPLDIINRRQDPIPQPMLHVQPRLVPDPPLQHPPAPNMMPAIEPHNLQRYTEEAAASMQRPRPARRSARSDSSSTIGTTDDNDSDSDIDSSDSDEGKEQEVQIPQAVHSPAHVLGAAFEALLGDVSSADVLLHVQGSADGTQGDCYIPAHKCMLAAGGGTSAPSSAASGIAPAPALSCQLPQVYSLVWTLLFNPAPHQRQSAVLCRHVRCPK